MTLSKLNSNELRELASDFNIHIPGRVRDKKEIIAYLDREISGELTTTATKSNQH
jgi:hypothetical protein